MRRLILWLGAAGGTAALLGAGATAAPLGASAGADSGDATLYCTPGGGPLGAVTDAEHTVLLGDQPLPPGVRRSRETVDGVSTPVMQAGPASSDEAVVFVHGVPGSSRDFDAMVGARRTLIHSWRISMKATPTVRIVSPTRMPKIRK